MRQAKRFLALGLGFSLIFGQTAYASEVLVTPFPTSQETQAVTQETAAPAVETAAPTPETAAPAAENTVAAPAVAGPAEATTAANIEDPIVVADGAVLMDASTGQVLYGKNQDTQYYPASITKVMTALVVLEHCNLNEVVTFSSTATTNLESGAVSLGIAAGDQLTVEQSLYGLLLKSANEIGNGLAEHVAGSVSAFADMMNAKAASLGCKNTHFANPHGLNNSTHKTTPYDMALIMRAALENATFRKIDTTTSYNFPATKNAAARTITMGHKMMYPTDSRYYEGIIGGKTGYTSLAGNTLVTGVERNGVRLVTVVMKARGTQYTDTKAMLDYGFNNYSALTGRTAGSSASTSAGASTSQAGPAGSAQTTTQAAVQTEAAGWHQDSNGWYLVKQDGTKATNEWQTVDGKDYRFNENGYMLENAWVELSGNWYYLGSDGALLKNTTTPDNYTVDGNGVWIQ